MDGKTKVLLTYQSDYADEFTLYGCMVMEQAGWERVQREMRELEWPRHYSFGTNEAVEYCDVDDFFNDITVTEITPSQYAAFCNMFGANYFGHWPDYLSEGEAY